MGIMTFSPLIAIGIALLLGAAGSPPAKVMVVSGSGGVIAANAARLVAADLSSQPGLRVVPPPKGKAAPDPQQLPALGRQVGASHAILIRVDGERGAYRLTATLYPTRGPLDGVALQSAPRAFRSEEELPFHAHQMANTAAVHLAGTPLPAKAIGIGTWVPPSRMNAEPNIAVKLEIDRPGGVYRPGDRVQCTVGVDRDSYLAIYNIDSTGKAWLLVPSGACERDKLREEGDRWVSTLRVKAGVTYQVPEDWAGPGKSLVVLEDQPVGFETLIAVASTQPVPLPIAPEPGTKDFVVVPHSPGQLAQRQSALMETQSGAKGAAEVRFTTDTAP